MATSRLSFGNLRVTLSRNDDNANWQFCCYISKEKKQFRKSTKTAVLETAKEVAQSIVVDILSKERSGQKVFSVTLGEARRDWMLELDKKVTRPKGLNPRTRKNAINHLKWGFKYLEASEVTTNTPIDRIPATIWKDYTDWRLRTKPTSLTVIHQELVTIRSLFKHAKEQGWCTDINIPKIPDAPPAKEGPRRRRITHQEIEKTLKAVSIWARGNRRRWMFEAVLYGMHYTGCRTGELLALRGKDIEHTLKEVIIHINRSKTGSRSISVVHSGAIHFAGYISGNPTKPDQPIFNSSVFYHLLKQARNEGIIAKDFDPYHLRHGFATTQIEKRESLALIAQHMGTSTSMLERTYNNVITAMIGRQFGQTKLVRKEDGTTEVVKR